MGSTEKKQPHPRCLICGKKFVAAKDSITGTVTGYVWKGACEHIPEEVVICIG